MEMKLEQIESEIARISAHLKLWKTLRRRKLAEQSVLQQISEKEVRG